MHQYFCEEEIRIGKCYEFTKEQAHHAGTVLRMNEEEVRLVHDGKGYFAMVHTEGKRVYADVLREDERYNELPVEVTLCMALIRREKMEFVLQKATEIGVTKIVPFESSRCVVHARKEKSDKQLIRQKTILQEAAAQCKRNRVPALTEVVKFADIFQVEGDVHMAAYENAYGSAKRITDHLENGRSVVVAIGPEGGFSQEEVEELSAHGYIPVTLGKRILRAETAALYACSVISEFFGE